MNNAFKEAANGPMKGVLAVCEEPLVSVDFRWVVVCLFFAREMQFWAGG